MIAMNLQAAARADFVTIDFNLNSAGAKLGNLLNPQSQLTVEQRGARLVVRVPLTAHELAILKLV
jgi:hypothetical protein